MSAQVFASSGSRNENDSAPTSNANSAFSTRSRYQSRMYRAEKVPVAICTTRTATVTTNPVSAAAPPTIEESTVVAVDAATHAPCSTNLLEEGFDAAPSGFDPADPDLDNILVTGYFNLDLYHWMDGLPRSPGRYHVFATVGDVVSNVVTIEVSAS